MNELLSPAGTLEAFYAAISNGCNAIYLGLDKFNARAYASNFGIENLKELLDYAHLRNVKIYVTMNTIAFDYELDEIYETIDKLATLGVDALIVQDLAILNYVLNKYKSLHAHASTQMGIDDVEGAKLLNKMGVTQIVFARETPLSMLRKIKNCVNVKIETFIHGALCVSYSGNCLMSSMIGERSGNRGRCAGCCRQLYTLYDTNKSLNIKTGYLLSMKDLDTSNNINDMRFIDSFKIEGRMKDPNYVANVTNYYRELIDNKNPSHETLDKIFNRTYTKGYLNSESPANITNIEKPNNFGYLCGEIARIDKNIIYIKLFKPLHRGDQIRIESNNILEEISIPVITLFDGSFKKVDVANKMGIIYTNERVSLKAKVYITKDINFIKETNQALLNREYNRLGIDIEFTAKINSPLLLKMTYNGTSSYASSDFVIQKALTTATTKENIINQIDKLKDTPYCIENISVNMDDDIFLPLKLINELRRNAIDELNAKRLARKVVLYKEKELVLNNYEKTDKEICVEVNNDEQYLAAKECGIKHIYYKNKIRRNNAIYIECEDEVLIGGFGGIEFYKNKNVDIISDYSFNITNSDSLAVLASLGVDRITLSQEISKENIIIMIDNYKKKYNVSPNLELIVYGRTYVMHTRYCPLKRLNMCGKCKESNYALKDKFASFPLLFNSDCTVSILNSKTLNLMDDVIDIDGINYFRLVFTTEAKDEVTKIINAFKNKLENKSKDKLFDYTNDTRGRFVKNPL